MSGETGNRRNGCWGNDGVEIVVGDVEGFDWIGLMRCGF